MPLASSKNLFVPRMEMPNWPVPGRKIPVLFSFKKLMAGTAADPSTIERDVEPAWVVLALKKFVPSQINETC
jgi:hypothetical protein